MTEITIIGTAHTTVESDREVEETIREIEPDAVTVELDHEQAKDYLDGVRDSPIRTAANLLGKLSRLSNPAKFIFLVFAIPQTINMSRNGNPRGDMFAGIEVGNDVGADVYPIDEPALETLEKAAQCPPFADLPGLLFRPTELLDRMNAWEERTPELPEQFREIDVVDASEEEILAVVEYMHDVAPDLADVFLTQRNELMVRWIEQLSEQYDSIVVVVGKAHVPGIKELLDQ